MKSMNKAGPTNPHNDRYSVLAAAQQFEHLNNVWGLFKKNLKYYYQMGPFTLCLVFTNEKWAERITISFHHLAIPPVDHPDLTVRLWDTVSTGERLPDLDWNLIHCNGYRGSSEPPFYFHYFDSIHALTALNVLQNIAYYIVRDSHTLPWWIDGSPLQVILHVWLREHGLQLTHTAAVGNEEGAVLLCGKGGSGKTTTTLSCLMSGLNYLGEDYCILKPGVIPRVYSIYQSAKWGKNTRKTFPNYESFIRNYIAAQTEKALVYYQDIFPDQIRKELPIRAIVSLKVGVSNQPILQPCNKEHVLRDLMMSTVMQLPFSHSRTMRILKDVVAKATPYHLTLGRDFEANVSMIKELLEQEQDENYFVA